jgi:hypothetical protein
LFLPPAAMLLSTKMEVQASGLRLCSRDGCATTAIFMGALLAAVSGCSAVLFPHEILPKDNLFSQI